MSTSTDPAAQIDALRGEIDSCDAQIIELVQRRVAISQEIGALRTASGGTRLSPCRAGRRRRLARDGAVAPGPRPALTPGPVPGHAPGCLGCLA
jgi:chorismate mutase